MIKSVPFSTRIKAVFSAISLLTPRGKAFVKVAFVSGYFNPRNVTPFDCSDRLNTETYPVRVSGKVKELFFMTVQTVDLSNKKPCALFSAKKESV